MMGIKNEYIEKLIFNLKNGKALICCEWGYMYKIIIQKKKFKFDNEALFIITATQF